MAASFKVGATPTAIYMLIVFPMLRSLAQDSQQMFALDSWLPI
jgi:hypothetical protein